MTAKPLGKLESVPLRDHWLHEGRHFSTWLATDEGLQLLSDVVSLELELLNQEKQVGPFKADILARDVSSGEEHFVVIENQLEKTNHDHLGKIVTYAAGLRATTVIWIAESFTDEHRQALDWLNENTGGNVAFYGLQIELWRIAGSPPAPQFKIISQPNPLAKVIQPPGDELTESKVSHLHFWQELKAFAQDHKPKLNWRDPKPRGYYSLRFGKSGYHLSLAIKGAKKRVQCRFIITHKNAKPAFDSLQTQAAQIQTELGMPLNWQRLDNNSRCSIEAYKDNVDIDDPVQRQDAKDWLFQTAERFGQVFGHRIDSLNLASGDEDESED